MAISRGKMLGHYTKSPGGYRCYCCGDRGKSRWRKRKEAREVATEVEDEMDAAKWVWVSLPYATFLLAVKDGVVVEAAPIARKSVGCPEVKVAEYYRRQGARFAVLGA